jgi:hypothetical protein
MNSHKNKATHHSINNKKHKSTKIKTQFLATKWQRELTKKKNEQKQHLKLVLYTLNRVRRIVESESIRGKNEKVNV